MHVQCFLSIALTLFSCNLFAQQETDSLRLKGHFTNTAERPFVGKSRGDTLSKVSFSRYLIGKPDISKIRSDYNGLVVLKIKVDSSGKIVGVPVVDKSRSTIADSRVVDDVVRVVVEGCLYNSSEKALEELSITVRIIAN